MSQQYDNTNRWVLFKNDRKTKDTHPDYSGTLNVDGVEYFLDAWVKDGAKGKFFSGSVKRKDKQAMQGLADDLRANSPQAPARGRAAVDDSDIPF
jgi:hypothetical protein